MNKFEDARMNKFEDARSTGQKEENIMGKYEQDARLLLEYVGGKENIAAVSHCVSRMRFVLNDPAKADVAKIEALKSAKGTFTQAGQFQHFHKSDFVQLLRSRYDTWISGINTVHVSIDIAHISFQTCRNRNSSSIAAAAAQSCDLSQVSNALEPGNDNYLAFVQSLLDLTGLYV